MIGAITVSSQNSSLAMLFRVVQIGYYFALNPSIHAIAKEAPTNDS